MMIMHGFMRAAPVAAILVGTMGFAILGAPGASQAQGFGASDMRAVNDQMAQMQRELNVLQKHVYQGRADEIAQAGPGTGNLAGFQLRLDDIESQMRDLNGRMEELNHRVNQLNDRLDKFSSDLDFRLSNAAPAAGQAGGSAAAAPPPSADAPITLTPPPPSSGDPSRAPSVSGNLGTLPLGSSQSASVPPAAAPPASGGGMSVRSDQALPDGTPEEQYKYAFALLTQSDYPAAERALTAFLAAHPKHQLAGNAQYWLGETYYVRNDFNNAVRAFAMSLQNYRNGPKAPDSVLKLGMSLSALGKTKEACTSYGLLKSDYPKAPQEVTRRAAAEQKRLRCT